MFKGGTNDPNSAQVKHHGLLKYPFTLNFYDIPPLYDVTIEEFEESALDRLRILAEIESSAARNRTWEELKSVTVLQCQKYLPLHSTLEKSFPLDSERERDHLSHFVLRLAFCRSEDLRRRFVKAETTLFKVRFEGEINNEREGFLHSRDFNWIAVGDEEQGKLSEELSAGYPGPKFESERGTDKYFKVKWTRVPDLVEKRRVFLKGGWAYVPTRELSSLVFQEFEDRLEKSLEITTRLLPRLDEDKRIIPILNNLSQGFLAGISSEWASASGPGSGDDIKAEMVDELSKRHFPLCMRTLHDNLQRDNHLKYFGRLQYGLFLKVLGVSIEEAVIFWRKSFSRITDDKFNKEYKYNIRHSYGLEGKRHNYPAKSCLQILTPGPSEYGCPYRNYSPENLQSSLLSMYSHQGLRSADLPEVMANVKATHFHVACTRVFELTHSSCGVGKGEGVDNGESVTHPNQYASRSMELYKAKEVAMPALNTFMSQRRSATKSNDMDEQRANALHQYQDTDGHFSLVRNFRLADLVTIMNGVCGSFSIFSSARYLLTNDPDYLWTAMAFPLAGLMFDFLDGKVARWRRSSSMLGQELDSLADLISFGVAPSLLAFVVGLRTYLDTVVLTGFICCGLARLARFNATVALIPKNNGGKAKYFEGLPIPSSLALVAVLSYWTKQGWIEGQQGVPWGTITLWGEQGGRGEIHVVSFIFACWAAAMVSKTLRVPKL